MYYARRVVEALIKPSDCAYFVELFGDILGEPVDLLVETPGGDTDATEAIVRLLQTLNFDLRVVVPSAAKSNGTLLSLLAREILMGPCSELGPIEPSLSGIPCSVLVDPEMAKTNFPLHKLGKDALENSKKLAGELLKKGMMKSKTDEEVNCVVEALAGRDVYKSHGSVINHRAATELGLNVAYFPEGDELWSKIWFLYCMYEHDLRRDGSIKIYEGRSRSTQIAKAPKTA